MTAAVVPQLIPNRLSIAMLSIQRRCVAVSDLCVAQTTVNVVEIVAELGRMAVYDAYDTTAFPVVYVEYPMLAI